MNWDDDERSAWSPPEQLSTSQWSTKYRVMTRRQSNRTGPWCDDNQPILRGFMNLCDRVGVIREIWFKKFNQGGMSEAIRNVIGRRAHLHPCPVQIVLPNREKGREIVRRRIIPLFEDTIVLAALLTGRKFDLKQNAITLKNGFELGLAYAGSPASIASDPQMVVILDEVDKYDYRGIQADPVAEARARTRTFGNRGLVIAISTPSIPEGPISLGYDECPTKLFYFVPCPHCGTFQRLLRDNLVWDSCQRDDNGELRTVEQRAARIRVLKLAWMKCINPNCATTHAHGEGKIRDHHKRDILCRGYWGTLDGTWRLWYDGREDGGPMDSDRVGLHASALYDVQTSFADGAAAIVVAGADPKKLKDVYNLFFGEEFHLQVEKKSINVFESKSLPAEGRVLLSPRIVPRWVSRLVMTVDTQKDHFYYVIRGWGFNYRSARIDHGRVSSFEELAALQLDAHWPYENDAFEPLRIHMVGIDSGGGTADESEANRTDQVYQWCNLDPIFRIPLKGAAKPFEQHIGWRDVMYQDPKNRRAPYRVRLHTLDPLYWRDLLDSYITATIAAVDRTTGESTQVERWALNLFNDPDYNRHLSNLHKVQIKKGSGYIVLWRPVSVGARHDYDDCERYNLAMAHGPARCGMLPSPEEIAEQRRIERQASTSGGVRMPDGRPFFVNRR